MLNIFTSGVNALSGNSFTVQGYDAAGNVTLSTPLGSELEAGRDLVEIAARSVSPVPTATTTLRFSAKALGAWGDSVSARVRPMVGAALTVPADPHPLIHQVNQSGENRWSDRSERCRADGRQVAIAGTAN